jgi:hypothetical protein
MQDSDNPREEEEVERRTSQEKEHMVRAVDLSILSGEGAQTAKASCSWS